ncbi:MAG: GNAT family N-acetyltransferase, partial [Methanobacteriota archaeon]
DEEDARVLWEWANDPGVRSASFSQAPILWEEHLAWFTARLRDPGCGFFIVTTDDRRPIGQVRLQYDGATAEIHVSLAPGERGRGVGVAAIRAATGIALREGRAAEVLAHVKPDNAGSLVAFERAGFARVGAIRFKGHDAVLFVHTQDPARDLP